MQFKITNDNHDMVSYFHKLIIKGIISKSDDIYILDIPVDSVRSKGFYIQADTLYFGDGWIGTISNGNEVYLLSSTGTVLDTYQRPGTEKKPALPVAEIVASQLEQISAAQLTPLDNLSARNRSVHIAHSMFPKASKSVLYAAPNLLRLLGTAMGKSSFPLTPQSGYTDEDSLSDISNVSSYCG